LILFSLLRLVYSHNNVKLKLADLLDTTVGYLLGETEDDQLLKDPRMMERLRDIKSFEEQEENQIYFTLDALIREIKNRRTYAL
jgi:hypothetical protein